MPIVLGEKAREEVRGGGREERDETRRQGRSWRGGEKKGRGGEKTRGEEELCRDTVPPAGVL